MNSSPTEFRFSNYAFRENNDTSYTDYLKELALNKVNAGTLFNRVPAGHSSNLFLFENAK